MKMTAHVYSTLLTCGLALLAAVMPGTPAQAEAGKARIRFGVCTSVDNINALQAAGFDYLESGLSSLAGMSDEKFAEVCKKVDASKIKVESFNGMLGKDLKITGDKVDLEAVRAYLKKAYPRAQRLGGKIIVFGSGGARSVPEGFSKEKAMEQLVEFGRLAADEAKPFGLTIVVEPLRKKETNIINTVSEGLDYVKKIDRPNFRAFGDFFHMSTENEGMTGILASGSDYLKHMHIARLEGRTCPLPGDGSYASYKELFDTLNKIGYDGRVSIEGKTDVKKDLKPALALLRGLAAGKPDPAAK